MFVRKGSLVVALLLAAAGSAYAQQAENNEGAPKYYGFGSAGAAFATETGATFAAEYGERLGSRTLVYVNYAYYDNLMGDTMQSNLDIAGTFLTTATGNVRTFSGRDRGLAFTGGAKFLFLRGSVRPYVGGGGGVLHLKRTITEATLGNVTTSFLTESGLSDGVVEPDTAEAMKPLAEVVFGVQATAGRHALFDVSYRFRQAFHADSLSFSQFSAGVGVGF